MISSLVLCLVKQASSFVFPKEFSWLYSCLSFGWSSHPREMLARKNHLGQKLPRLSQSWVTDSITHGLKKHPHMFLHHVIEPCYSKSFVDQSILLSWKLSGETKISGPTPDLWMSIRILTKPPDDTHPWLRCSGSGSGCLCAAWALFLVIMLMLLDFLLGIET